MTWNQSKQFNTRPSELLGLGSFHGDPVCTYFDQAVYYFGQCVEEDINEAMKAGKNDKQKEMRVKTAIMKWIDQDNSMIEQRFASPTIGRR